MIPRLGVNLDHIATLRQLRNTPYPSLIEAAEIVKVAGAQLITIHLREDRRHIQTSDLSSLTHWGGLPINLEMALSTEVLNLAIKFKPQWVCIVPEKRQELTTEGGLDIKKSKSKLQQFIPKLKKAGIRISLFIEPSRDAVRRAADFKVDAVELHTGKYCRLAQGLKRVQAKRELQKLFQAAQEAQKCGLQVHAGHGFDNVNVRNVALLLDQSQRELIEEYNIGHWIVARASLVGLERATQEMLASIQAP